MKQLQWKHPTTTTALDSSVNTPPVPVRHSTRVSRKPAWMTDYVDSTTRYPLTRCITYEHVSPEYRTYMNAITNSTDPTTFSKAVKDEKWCIAMNQELQALEANGAWNIVDLPKGKHVIGCKWIYKIKYKSDGSVEKYKARLVALGYRQQCGVDYEETFASVAKLTTVRALLAVVAMRQ